MDNKLIKSFTQLNSRTPMMKTLGQPIRSKWWDRWDQCVKLCVAAASAVGGESSSAVLWWSPNGSCWKHDRHGDLTNIIICSLAYYCVIRVTQSSIVSRLYTMWEHPPKYHVFGLKLLLFLCRPNEFPHSCPINLIEHAELLTFTAN
jgi:hypothetical protein